tara:strand:- start:2179 stop:2649 length:471 start_codon:yes stop_codon:yes gene_type:complete
MENLFKKILMAGLVLVVGSTLVFVYLNHIKAVKIEANLEVNSLIQKETFKNRDEVLSYIKKSESKKYNNSSYLLPLLSSNYFLKINNKETALEILKNISNSESPLINDLAFSLQSRIYAEMDICDKSRDSFKKINSYNSIATDTRTYIGKCLEVLN